MVPLLLALFAGNADACSHESANIRLRIDGGWTHSEPPPPLPAPPIQVEQGTWLFAGRVKSATPEKWSGRGAVVVEVQDWWSGPGVEQVVVLRNWTNNMCVGNVVFRPGEQLVFRARPTRGVHHVELIGAAGDRPDVRARMGEPASHRELEPFEEGPAELAVRTGSPRAVVTWVPSSGTPFEDLWKIAAERCDAGVLVALASVAPPPPFDAGRRPDARALRGTLDSCEVPRDVAARAWDGLPASPLGDAWLRAAAASGEREEVQALLDAGVELPDPLHWGASPQAELVAHGVADANGGEEWYPEDLAAFASSRRPEVRALVLEFEVEPEDATVVLREAFRLDGEMVAFLLERGADPGWGGGRSPLATALERREDGDPAGKLLAAGAPFDPLAFSVVLGWRDPKSTRWALALGADPNAPGRWGRVPLENATRRQARILRRHGAKLPE